MPFFNLQEGRDELARRALEILKSKSEDKTSYEAIANALHLATEEVLPKRARAHACRTVMVISKCHGSSRFDKSAEQCVRRLIISNLVQDLAVLHCKVLAEHFNMLLEKVNPSGFLSAVGSCQ